MIHSKENGITEIQGSPTLALAEFACIARSVAQYHVDMGICDEKEAWERIDYAFEMAKKPEEEIKKEGVMALMRMILNSPNPS